MLPIPIIEKITFPYYKVTQEKIWHDNGQCSQYIARKEPAKILIEADHINKTISINGRIFKFVTNYGHVYQIGSKTIGGSNFIQTLTHFKEAADPNNVFHIITRDALLKYKP